MQSLTDRPICDFIREVCERFGPRPPGTAAETKTARFIAATIEEFCDETGIKEHRCSPTIHKGGATVFLCGYLLTLLAYVYAPTIAAIMLGILLIVLYLARFRGYEILDPLFPRRTTQNVLGKVKPREKVERIVIFAGHHDSAHYMPLFRKRFRKFLVPAFYSILGSHLILALAICTRLFSDIFAWLSPVSWFFYAISLAGGIIFLLFRLFLFSDIPVMGANDNLAGVAVAIEAARYFAANRPKNTEVWAVSFGAEECGLRGSKRFARKHRIELKNASLINIEMVGAGKMVVVEGEKSAGTRHSREVVKLILESARRCGIPMSGLVAPFGETDATSFTRLGLKAATIAAIDDENFPPNWHVPEDIPEHVDEDHLQQALRVCVGCVRQLEESD